ncbi:Metallo-dependent phosphatase-like protein [Bisporella sp. PMI_857]|nr:Metallo-dependent phosphatase-like protein [Bisporella sp. PMI_857]
MPIVQTNRGAGPDTIKILIATDSHVGYEERDPVRKDDSWRSFDEVLRLARSEDVDMVLLAGDLFHENQPSRKAMYQVMKSLRENCLGDKPCELEMLSDPSDVLNGDQVNYESLDINVAIPVFSIHGNHDDPTGEGNYCALDLLQVSGLLNYIGRMPESDNIEIKPVLLQKGQTKLALYGMSNVRDERLYRTFKDGKVKFYTPGVQPKDWYNIMAVHQNHHAHTETGYLPENFLPEFMDLIVWGHEHECLIDPRFNDEMQFHVMQPGSSVATSLVAGEAVAKHVAIAYVTGRTLETENIRIKSVRPFITRDIVLAEDKRFKKLADDQDNRPKITAGLIDIVNELIEEAVQEWEAIQDPDDMPDETPLPLVRLRVDYAAPEEGGKFDCENPQRFSNRFLGKVANVNDVVHFHMKRKASKMKKVAADLPAESVLAAMAAQDNVKVEKLVREYLAATSLKILPQTAFGDAVDLFVVKDDKHAMEQFVNDSLNTQVREMMKLGQDDEDDDEDLDPIMEQLRQRQEELFAKGDRKVKSHRKVKPKPAIWDSDIDGHWENAPEAYSEDDESLVSRPSRAADDDASVMSDAAPIKKAAAKRAPAKRAPTKTKAPTKLKAPAKKATPARGRKKATEPSDDEDDDIIMLDESPPPVKAQPKRAVATRTRQSQLNFSQVPKTQTQTPRELSDDEISDDDAFQPMASLPSSRRR